MTKSLEARRNHGREPVVLHKRCLNQINYYRHQATPVKYSTLIKLKPDLRSTIWESVLKSNQKHVQIIAFCLMPNHFHFLLKQLGDQGISKFMSDFQNSYSRYFNTKNSRTGPLMNGKFQAVRIENDEQLLHVSRYIHLNPLIGSVVRDFPELLKYKWSSLPEYTNHSELNICNEALILDHFQSRGDYLKFLSDQVDYARQLDFLKHLNLE